MPYILPEDRRQLEKRGALTSGELTYLFTKIAIHYLRNTKVDYQHYNDVIGALECCKLELYRRQIALYEDKKRQENGDVV